VKLSFSTGFAVKNIEDEAKTSGYTRKELKKRLKLLKKY